VDDLVLPQALAHLRLIGKQACEGERQRDAHFLAQPAAGGLGRVLAVAGMGAAGIGPLAGRVVFVRRAPLHQHAPGRVENQHRDGAVAQVLAVGGELAGPADRPVGGIDQDDLFLAHAKILFLSARARAVSGRGCRDGGAGARRAS